MKINQVNEYNDNTMKFTIYPALHFQIYLAAAARNTRLNRARFYARA